MTGSLLDVRREGGACVLTLQRPEKLNALSSALERELAAALATDEVRSSACVVVTGTGRAFSAGADITEFADRDPEAILRYYRDTGRIYEDVASLPQPTISAVHGYCLGGGLELALATDFRVADETAVFGFPEVGLGILPSSGGTVRAARLLGAAQAKRLILLGGRLTAAEALGVGLVTEVVAEGRALERSLELARGLAELPGAALSVAKQAIDAAAEATPAAAHLIERLAYGLLAQTPAARQAAEEFRGKS
jgi:enoyl-CoA hydratase/carnithine racemase